MRISKTNGRSNSYLVRVVPMLLLAIMYLAIAGSKIAHVVTSLGDLSEDWPRHLVLALHSLSGAIFFGALGLLMFTRKEPIHREKRLVGWALPTLVMTAMAGVGWQPPSDLPTAVLLVGTFFVVIGTGFTLYALRHLGRHFGVVSDVRGLVTTGPYQFVRHPLYGGETLTIIGLVIAVASPFAIAAFTIGMALQIWRAKVEEQSLTAAFPEYREYAERTPMLIPFLKLPARMPEGLRTADQ